MLFVEGASEPAAGVLVNRRSGSSTEGVSTAEAAGDVVSPTATTLGDSPTAVSLSAIFFK